MLESFGLSLEALKYYRDWVVFIRKDPNRGGTVGGVEGAVKSGNDSIGAQIGHFPLRNRP